VNLLYPKIRRSHVWPIIRITLLGGMLGGMYGAIHDGFTYAISSEYFTLMKFEQFAHVDFGFSPPVLLREEPWA